MTKNIAVVLAGCGVYDGSEIHEAVLTLLALDQRGASVSMFAPNVNQHHVINHLTGSPVEETRNVLVEAARIARGDIKPLELLDVEDIDAIIFPGGFGAAKNLSSFAFDGAEMTVHPQVERVIAEARASQKALGFICIAPVIASKLIPGVSITLGAEGDASQAAETMGANHIVATVDAAVIDIEERVVSCPAYMLGPNIADVHKGIDRLVGDIMECCQS